MTGSKQPRSDAIAMGKRIAEFREKRGLNQTDLARLVGVQVQSVQQWETGQTQPKPRNLPKIAAALGKSIHAIMEDAVSDEGLFNGTAPLAGLMPRRIPLVSTAPAGWPRDTFDQRISDIREPTVPTFYPVSASAFALRVYGDSMEPLFPNGCVITVEPSIQPKNGMFVVVRMDGTSEHTFKQLIIDGLHRFLKPINSRYPIIELTEAAIVCGVVVEHHQFHVPGAPQPWDQ